MLIGGGCGWDTFYVVSGAGEAPDFIDMMLPVRGIMTADSVYGDHGFVQSIYTDELDNKYRVGFFIYLNPEDGTFTGSIHAEINEEPFAVTAINGTYEITNYWWLSWLYAEWYA